MLNNKILILFFEALLKIILQYSDRIVVIGEDMSSAVEKMCNRKKIISVIHNWADADSTKPIDKKDNLFIKQNNIIDKYIVMYSGNFGLAHDFSAILSAAEILRSNLNVRFIFIGEGKQQSLIEDAIIKKKLPNVTLYPFQSKAMLNYSLAAADISLISLIEGLEGYIVPSKIYRLMAAGKSIIFLGSRKSIIAQIIENAHCGFTIQNASAMDLVELIEKQFNDKIFNQQLGKNARNYFENNYQRSIAIKKYSAVIRDVI